MAIYDCFMLFNEIDLLKIRLRLLYEHVDHFVIVEMNQTYHGHPKPWNFEDHKTEFSSYIDKIIYIQVTDPPNFSEDDRWGQQVFQRNCIMRGLGNCRNDDIILISDLDEIPNPKIFTDFDTLKPCFFSVNLFRPQGFFALCIKIFYFLQLFTPQFIEDIRHKDRRTLPYILRYTPVALRQRYCLYYMNCVNDKILWGGTIISKYKHMSMPNEMRRHSVKFPVLKNAGWHFTFLGGVDAIKTKLNEKIDFDKRADFSYDSNHIKQYMKAGIDIENYGTKYKYMERYKFIDVYDIGIPFIQEIVNKFPYFFL